jgi:hypothetical protein
VGRSLLVAVAAGHVPAAFAPANQALTVRLNGGLAVKAIAMMVGHYHQLLITSSLD